MKHKYPPITLGSPGEDISSKDLHAIIQRFKNLNQYRLLSVQNFLQPRQRIFLQLLPLIFHQNQALLPGFISTETPAGIPDYTPNKATVQGAKLFSKNYRYTRRALPRYAIEGIFLMGSVGSVAFSKTSDMDIWLCHVPTLSVEEIDELQQKANAVERWAYSLDLEVHFFLMDSEQFKLGENAPISSESSGQTQHYLLLEEFYRTAIYVSGKAPAWWIVPPHQEDHYSEYIDHLLENRFIAPAEVIDFGGLEAVPAEEFISATLWHIYKSLGSPYKSLLKLFLMECYASEYPKTQWLCQSLKRSIYQGEFDIDKLDPYLMIYEKVEEYLHLVASQKRLSLSRQCFYLKIMGSSPRSLDPISRSFREQYLQNIAKQWRWPYDMLGNFSKHRYWDIHKATQEHAIIRDQLKQCLRMILRFAGQHVEEDYRENKDLKLIGRKLHAYLESRRGKIEVITTRYNVQKKEDELSIIEIEQEHAEPLWHLYCGHVTTKNMKAKIPVKESESLLEILCWIVINGLYHETLKIHLESHGLNISAMEAKQLLIHIHRFFSSCLKAEGETLKAYTHPNQLLASLLFINIGETLPEESSNTGPLFISDRSDPLSYGEHRQCFVRRIDRVSISSWGEITLERYPDIEGFFHCISDVFNDSRKPLAQEMLQVICDTPLRAKTIVWRINTLFSQLIKFFNQPASNWRYLLPAKSHYYLFERRTENLTYRKLETNERLLQELSTPQHQFAPVHFDQYVLSQTYIPFLYTHIAADTLQVFYHVLEKQVALYVIDENAALFTRQYQDVPVKLVLADYFTFLHSLVDNGHLPAQLKIRFIEIQKNSAGIISCHVVKTQQNDSFEHLSIPVVVSAGVDNALRLSYNGREFSSASDKNTFVAIREHIWSSYQLPERYPFYVSEIDVPAKLLGVEHLDQAHAVHYLQYKHQIETQIMNNDKG